MTFWKEFLMFEGQPKMKWTGGQREGLFFMGICPPPQVSGLFFLRVAKVVLLFGCLLVGLRGPPLESGYGLIVKINSQQREGLIRNLKLLLERTGQYVRCESR